MDSSGKDEPLLQPRQPRQPSRRSATLGCSYCIFLVQYAVQFMISPFFPTSPAGRAIGIRLVSPNPSPSPLVGPNRSPSADQVGAVFAAYPLATVIATPFVPCVLRALGMRRAIPAGLCVTALGSLLFGVLPSLVSSPLALSIGLLGFRCLGGLGAAVSETGCLTIISTGEAMEARAARVAVVLDVVGVARRPCMYVPMQEEDGHLGVALSSVEVCTGVGAAVGTALGGLLFRLGGATPFGDFLFPFVVGAAPPYPNP